MFLPRLAGFYIKSLSVYLSNLGKNLTRSRFVKLLRLLHISPRIRSIMYTIIVVQMFLHKYCYMQCNMLFSHVKNSVLNVISDALFEFKSKDKYERKMLSRLKRNFERKICINLYLLLNVTSLIFLWRRMIFVRQINKR